MIVETTHFRKKWWVHILTLDSCKIYNLDHIVKNHENHNKRITSHFQIDSSCTNPFHSISKEIDIAGEKRGSFMDTYVSIAYISIAHASNHCFSTISSHCHSTKSLHKTSKRLICDPNTWREILETVWLQKTFYQQDAGWTCKSQPIELAKRSHTWKKYLLSFES